MNEERRMSIEEKRFTLQKDGTASDNFMLAFLEIKLATQTKITRLNRKFKEKELQRLMDALCITDTSEDPAVLRAEWKDMAERYIHVCFDPQTRQKAYGLIKRKDEAVAWQLLKEIERTTKLYPEALGREEEFRPLYEAMQEAWEEILGDTGKGTPEKVDLREAARRRMENLG